MYRFFARRLLMMLPVILGVMLIVFSMMYITPGDPARIILGDLASAEDVALMRTQLGLDEPFVVQFGNYLKNAVTKGDLGLSYATQRPVTAEIMERFPTTMLLASLGTALAVLIGIPAGIVAATRQYSVFDHVVTVISLIGTSMPAFWMGLVLILAFSVQLGWLPSSGFYDWHYWILPAITLGTGSAAVIMRMTRSSMLEVITQDYIRTARAKGQSEGIIIRRHALKNAYIPVITAIGLQFGMLLGGSVLTESVFSIPGIGKYMVDSIKTRDFPVVQGGVLFIAIVCSFVNLAVDLIYAYVDPRIKSQYKGKVVSKGGNGRNGEKEPAGAEG